MSFEDKRRNKRFDVELAVVVRRADVDVAGVTQNLSLGGLMADVPLDPSPALGQRLRVSFSLPGLDGPIQADAEVRWCSGSVVGLQFVTGLRAKETWALGRFLESLAVSS